MLNDSFDQIVEMAGIYGIELMHYTVPRGFSGVTNVDNRYRNGNQV